MRVFSRVYVCTDRGRADTSLSVVLMVPLTTQQLLHIGVVLAVGLKHTPQRLTQSDPHMHALIISCRDKKSQLVSAPFIPNSRPLLCFYDDRIYIWFSQTNTQTHTLCCSHRASSMCVCVCVSVSCQSSHHLLAYWIVNVWPLLRRGHTYLDLPSPLVLSFSFFLSPFYLSFHKTLLYPCATVCVPGLSGECSLRDLNK